MRCRRQLKSDQAATGNHPTINQKREMLERCSKVRRKLLAWIEVQTLFMPEVAISRAEAAAQRVEESGTRPMVGELVQDIPLLLPSQLDADVACLRELQHFELRLRKGQAHDALHNLRHHLLLRTHEYKYKDQNIRGVRDGMRSNTRIQEIDDQIARAAATYRVAWSAMQVLSGRLDEVGWEHMLRPLKAEDVRQMPEATFRKGGGKKRKKRETTQEKKRRRTEARTPISWIWLADGSAMDADRNEAMNEGESSIGGVDIH